MSTNKKKIKQLLPELEKPYVSVNTRKVLKKIAEAVSEQYTLFRLLVHNMYFLYNTL
jgi:hypothetical protein